MSSSEPWNPGVGYLSLGYMKNEEATSLAIDREGWLHTGDLCYIDMRGLVYVVDRIKELIKYKAYQVLFCSAFDDEHSICQFQPMLAWGIAGISGGA